MYIQSMFKTLQLFLRFIHYLLRISYEFIHIQYNINGIKDCCNLLEIILC